MRVPLSTSMLIAIAALAVTSGAVAGNRPRSTAPALLQKLAHAIGQPGAGALHFPSQDADAIDARDPARVVERIRSNASKYPSGPRFDSANLKVFGAAVGGNGVKGGAVVSLSWPTD